jgi:PhnB protein
MIKTSVQPIPEGYYTVTPFVIVKDSAKFIAFLKEAFDAVELFPPVVSEDGSIGHAEVRIGNSVVMMFDGKAGWPETIVYLRLYVEDCKAVYEQALRAGASSLTKPTHVPWGDLVARVLDPFGNIWGIQTRIENVDEAEMTKRMGEQKFIEAMQYVQSAEAFRSSN